MFVVTGQLQIPLSEFEITFVRSGGPGGQNVNKVNSKAVLRWVAGRSPSLPEAVRERFLQEYGNRLTAEGELLVTSQRYRDAPRNSRDCLEKLRDAARCRPSTKTPAGYASDEGFRGTPTAGETSPVIRQKKSPSTGGYPINGWRTKRLFGVTHDRIRTICFVP